MIKSYNLLNEGLQFKSDFNWHYEIIEHLFEVRTMKGYLKIDLIKPKKSNRLYLSRRIVRFNNNAAVFEIKGIPCPPVKVTVRV